VASDPFGVAAADTSAAAQQQSAGQHPLDLAYGDDPFAPGAVGCVAGVFGAQEAPNRQQGSSAEQYAAPVWQPTYGNLQQRQAPQQQQPPQPAHLHQQDSASTDDSFSFPKLSQEASAQHSSASGDFSFAKPQVRAMAASQCPRAQPCCLVSGSASLMFCHKTVLIHQDGL
jgi:hypothetical protein